MYVQYLSGTEKGKPMNKYTVYYKRVSKSPFITGKIANVDVHHAVVEAGNAAGAEKQTRQAQKQFMNSDIRIIEIIREINTEG